MHKKRAMQENENIETPEIDQAKEHSIQPDGCERMEYQPNYDEAYLSQLIKQATPNWTGINAVEWLHEFRGDYDD